MRSCPTERLCECGCGRPAPIATRTRRAIGHVKGQPLRFINGHNVPDRAPQVTLWDEPLRKIQIERGDYSTPCWRWIGKLNPVTGYGIVASPDGRQIGAHRRVYELLRRAIPDGYQLDHLCRNRRCVNPDHLEPVTQAENLRRGIRVKLTAAQVAEIRASDASQKYLAQRYGVHAAHISKIRSGRVWV